jgi:hypothetical protein
MSAATSPPPPRRRPPATGSPPAESLLKALDEQSGKPIPPLGQSLIELGLVTDEQLQKALDERNGELPLGERLVASGVLTRSGLQTALAHKMGYPIIDLNRFPARRRRTAAGAAEAGRSPCARCRSCCTRTG